MFEISRLMDDMRQNMRPVLPDMETANQTFNLQSEVRDLRFQVARMMLLNQALWELLRDRLQLKDADLERLAKEIDLRDGVEDGQVTNGPLQCPRCGRISNSRHWKCLYCGQEFEKPLMA